MAVDPDKVYHGKPCRRCGGTLRWKTSHGCVACARERHRERKRELYANDPEYRERERERMRKWRANHPEYRERRRKRWRERYANDPEYRERHLKRNREYKRERYWTDEEYRERELERAREWYYNLDHISYYERQLKNRRRMALKRKEARHANDT